MTYLNCPRCALSIRVRADYLAPRNCPRCIARHHVPVPMYATPHPARVNADGALLTDVSAPRANDLRRVFPEFGTDTAA